jgi:spore germination cell wall hydrolase CwlJ-like protein
MIWGEARGESATGMAAVAHTALNRAAKSPKSGVCSIVLAPKQYSIFNNNPALRAAAMSKDLVPITKDPIDQESWQKSVLVASMVMDGTMSDPTNGATAYLAPKIMKLKGYIYPKWSKEYKKVAIIDNHHFYKPVDKKAKPA